MKKKQLRQIQKRWSFTAHISTHLIEADYDSYLYEMFA